MGDFDMFERDKDARNDEDLSEAYADALNESDFDSDINEDRGRERLLDASFQDWYRNIGYWVQQKNDLTQVPHENVFDAAAGLDEEALDHNESKEGD